MACPTMRACTRPVLLLGLLLPRADAFECMDRRTFAVATGVMLASPMETMAQAPRTTSACPFNLLEVARGELAAASLQLEATRSAAEWGALRDAIAPSQATVRSIVKRDEPLRADFLAAMLEVDSFAYEQQRKNFRDKYPGGYQEFIKRLDVDISVPVDSLKRAQSSMDAIIAQYGECL